MVNSALFGRKYQRASGDMPNNSRVASVYPGTIQAPGHSDRPFPDIEDYARHHGTGAMLRLPARRLQIDRLSVFSFSI